MLFDFSPYQAVLLDLDGTLCNENEPLPGAAALIGRLKREDRKIACLSNSIQSPARVARRLRDISIDLSPDLLYTAAEAAANYCIEHYPAGAGLYSLASEGIAELLGERFRWVESELEDCRAVVVGNTTCVNCTLPRLRTGMHLIRRGAACLGICGDRAFPSPAGLEIGTGSVTRMLAYAANVQPIIFGKPERAFFQGLCDRLGVKAQDCILIGDNLDSDIGGAKNVGMRTILSLTGVTSRRDFATAPEGLRPDWVVQNLEEL
ncbi:MAG: HAD hydrolase-like protein [Tepidisphaeraceae bacterium]|jgi:HAD superfamily hydrolase (TIGR01450 family)